MLFNTNDVMIHHSVRWSFLQSFKSIGKNVLISDKAVFYNPENISIGDNSRIDDFAILSAGKDGIEIGRYVHIACYSSLIGQAKITLDDFSGISSRVSIFSSSDPYDGSWMTNPTVPESVRQTKHAIVYIGRHTVIGAGSIVLPGVHMGDGCAVGAMSLVIKEQTYLPNGIYAGQPAKYLRSKSYKIYELEKTIQ